MCEGKNEFVSVIPILDISSGTRFLIRETTYLQDNEGEILLIITLVILIINLLYNNALVIYISTKVINHLAYALSSFV